MGKNENKDFSVILFTCDTLLAELSDKFKELKEKIEVLSRHEPMPRERIFPLIKNYLKVCVEKKIRELKEKGGIIDGLNFDNYIRFIPGILTKPYGDNYILSFVGGEDIYHIITCSIVTHYERVKEKSKRS